MRAGVHCSIRNGFSGALEEAAAVGCETLQIFTQSPRGWRSRVYQDQEFNEFRKQRARKDIFPVVVHSPYLPNLCTNDAELYKKSIDLFALDLKRCEELGAEYLVIHPGAYSPESTPQTGIKNLITAFNDVLSRVPGKAHVLIENMAGGGRRLGGTFQEIAQMLDGIHEKSRVGVCLDTCHTFAAGYDIRTTAGVKKTLKEFDEEVGLEKIKVFHVNDSKGELGCHRDRHEHIGRGHVGLAGFKALFRDSTFKDCALILETPKEPMPQSDLNNLSTIRTCLPN